MIAHQSPISGIAAYDGKWVATAGYDNQIILWDAQQKTALARGWHDHLANQLCFSQDGCYLISASSDHTARLWSVPNMKLVSVLSDHGDDVEMALFHPTEKRIATACVDHHVRVFDFQGQLITCFKGHKAAVISVAWSKDGNSLISSSNDGTVKQWCILTRALVKDIDLGGIETDTIAMASDGCIYAGNDEGEIIIIRGTGIQKIPAHQSGIKRLVYHGGDQLLVSLSYDRMLKVWQREVGDLKQIAQSAIPAQMWPRSCDFLDRNTLVFATFGSCYAAFDIKSGQWNLDHTGPTRGVNAIIYHQSQIVSIGDAGLLKFNSAPSTNIGSLCNFLTTVGNRIYTGGQMGQLYDAKTGEIVYQHRSPLNCAASFIKDGVGHILVGAYTGEGLVFAIPQYGAVKHIATLQLHANAVKSIAASSNMLFAVCADSSAAWFSIDDFQELSRKPQAHGCVANSCVALPGDKFASVSRDRKLRIWKDFSATIHETPHSHSIKCVAASDDGRYLASGSYIGSIAIYDCVERQWRPCSRPTAAGISSLCFDPENRQFLAGSYDGGVYKIAIA